MLIKRHFSSFRILAVVSALLTTGCAWDQLELEPVPEVVSFSGDIQPMFDASCVDGCHAANLIPPNLSQGNSYDVLFSTSLVDTLNPTTSVLYVRMNETSTPMPPTGKLNQNTVNLVLAWIEQGAKND